MTTKKVENDVVGKGKEGDQAPNYKGVSALSFEMREVLSEKEALNDEPFCPTTVRVRSEVEHLLTRGRRFR